MSASRQLPAQIRDLNSEPDPQEPAYSYDDGVFYHPAEEMEDEFHERLAAAHYNNGNGSGNNRRVNSGGSDVCNSITSHSSSITGNGRNAGGSSSNSLNRSSGGSQTNNITNISLLPATDLTATTGGSGIQSLQREKQHLPTSAFWRTNKNNNTSSSVTSEANGSSNRTEQPAFSSVSFRDHPEEGSEVRNNKHNGRTISLLSNSLRQQAFGGNNSNSSISGNSPRPQSSEQPNDNSREEIRRHGSSVSMESAGSNKDTRKRREKDRAAERNRKHDSLTMDVDIGRMIGSGDEDEDDNNNSMESDLGESSDFASKTESMNHRNTNQFVLPGKFKEMQHNRVKALDRSSSDQSTGSLLYCKTPTTGGGPSSIHGNSSAGSVPRIIGGGSGSGSGSGSTVVNAPSSAGGMGAGNAALGKSSSLIFPTGVDAAGTDDRLRNDSEMVKVVRTKVNFRLDQCEAVRFPFKKKLLLDNLHLASNDIPMKDLCGTGLGNALHKLSLAKNRLISIPPQLVMSLPVLKTLDISQCELHQLPEFFNLPKLTRLNLSHNLLIDFPDEGILEGLPELQELNMYGNKVAEIVIPSNPKLMAKLEILDLGYNELAVLPDELDQLKSLRSLKLSNNHVTKVPMRVCEMDLKVIEVASNPVTIPPMETCERGICSMKRYWHCIRMEEQSNSKSKSFVESQKKIQPKSKTTGYGRLMNVMKKASTKSLPSGPPQLRKAVSLGSPEPTAHSSLRNSLPVSIHEEDTDDPQQNEQVDFQASLLMHEARRHGLVKTNSNESFDTGPSESLIEQAEEVSAGLSRFVLEKTVHDQVSINDTLKVIFVGMAMVGKTSMIKRLIEGKEAVVPTCDERTVGVDIYDWEPKNDKRFEHIDSRIEIQDEELRKACGDVDIKFSVWDFAGQHVYHATHELFFSNRSLYVLVWDMGANNEETKFRKISSKSKETGAFKLYDSSDEEDESNNEEDLAAEEEERRANRELEHDIDEKVQFWIDCIQSTSPGAAVLPVASFNDEFDEFESKRRCKVLKQRLLKQEERRVKGIEDRLNELNEQNRADDIAAAQLRKLICPYTRPKLIFGSDDDSVVRVSGTEYTGFDVLTEKIIGIATGKYIGRWKYPLFHGHVGARIPRMRLEVREAVRAMRGRFKVVEWGYFLNSLRDLGLTNIGDISDALHFLTNVGELSYFGGVMQSDPQFANPRKEDSMNCHADEKQSDKLRAVNFGENDDEDADDVDDDERTMLSMDNTSITSPSTNDGYSTSLEEFSSTGLSQYVFLNPRWLVAAVACILRHDLDREIKETRRMVASGGSIQLSHTASFYEAHLNCPVITAEDACMLWQCKRITKKAAERAQEYSNNTSTTPFDFLQAVLIRFGVFVPIDLSIEKVLFGGKEYQQLVHDMNGDADDLAHDPYSGLNLDVTTDAQFFFLPSLLGPCEPLDAWTYKTTDSWKTTLCHSILFPDGVPPGLMERLTASALSSIYAVSNEKKLSSAVEMTAYEGRLVVKEILCWRTAFYVKLGSQTVQPDGEVKESIVEIFSHLTGRDSQCVGSDFMGVGTSRLVTSGRGQIGDGGRRIWNGGYLLVCKCVQRVMSEYSGLEYEKQAFCPDCLAKKAVSEASSWDMSVVRSAVLNSEETLRCQHGHRVDIRFIAGPFDTSHNQKRKTIVAEAGGVPVQDLLGAVVVVGLWDGKTGKVVRVGSGFIADKKRGLIVTAAHTLMNIWGDKKYPFGENYYGLSRGKVVVGVIPREQEGGGKDLAVFRYFAQIVSKDPRLEAGECHIDACILRITTRLENDVGGDGEGCGDEPEIILLNDPKALKSQQLQSLKITEKCELEEPVRIVGYNQGGEGLVGPGESLNRFIDFAKGYVCMKFVHEEDSVNKRKERFKPREEIVVICPTIGGHSGGPCVNQQGEVVGILSRADPAENQRCYLVPASELKVLLNRAKKQL